MQVGLDDPSRSGHARSRVHPRHDAIRGEHQYDSLVHKRRCTSSSVLIPCSRHFAHQDPGTLTTCPTNPSQTTLLVRARSTFHNIISCSLHRYFPPGLNVIRAESLPFPS